MGSTFIAIEDAAANAQRESLAVFFFAAGACLRINMKPD